MSDWLTVHHGDCRDVLPTLPERSVHCVITSPPYWGLRDYGHAGQLGLEPTPEEYVANMVAVFREVRRVLRDDGTVWLNLGDSYAGSSQSGGTDPSGLLGYGNSGTRDVTKTFAPRRPLAGLKPKDLVGIPWRVAFALQADGWYLRSDIIWAKPNPMPESVTDRPTKSHEYVFLLAKSPRYYFDQEAVREAVTPDMARRAALGHTRGANGKLDASRGDHDTLRGAKVLDASGRNIRSVWNIATQPYPGAHFAVFPEALVEPCIKAGCPELGTVLDPFGGSGTVGRVANRLSRRAVLIELNADYIKQVEERTMQTPLGLAG